MNFDTFGNSPILYKKSKTGATQYWAVHVEGDSYYSVYGQIGGTATTGDKTVCNGKNIGRANETTPEQQAEAEARSDWQKKRDSGYVESIDALDGPQEFRSPMLAKNYDDLKKPLAFPVFSQPKLDGMRCVTSKDGMVSRGGKPIFSAPHIRKFLADFFRSQPDVVLDGELYSHVFKDDFNKIISLVKKQKPNQQDLADSAEHIEYWVYDIQDTSCGFSDRLEFLKGELADLSKNTNLKIRVVWTMEAQNQLDLDSMMDRYLKDGFEGQMVRLDKPYEFTRSASLLKRKLMQDEEFEIVDVIEGLGKRAGLAGAIKLRLPNGETFNSSIIGDMKYCTELLKNKQDVIGKMATIKFQNKTPAGVPRFPEFLRLKVDE
jgi:DNA ligase 1